MDGRDHTRRHLPATVTTTVDARDASALLDGASPDSTLPDAGSADGPAGLAVASCQGGSIMTTSNCWAAMRRDQS